MILFRIVSVPDVVEHLLAYPSVQFAHTVHFLTCVACKHRHTESLAVIIRVVASHTDELIPCYAEQLWIAAHIFSEESLVEIVVTCRYWCVNSIKRRSSYEFHGLVECQSFFHVVAKALQVTEGSVAFIAMVDVLLDAKFLQQKDTTHTQENLLLQSVLPIATIE